MAPETSGSATYNSAGTDEATGRLPVATLVVGGGAIGGYFGALLARGGHPVTVLARGEQLAAIRARGIEIVGGPDEGIEPVSAIADLRDCESPDLVLFTVKTHATGGLGQALKPLLRRDSIVFAL